MTVTPKAIYFLNISTISIIKSSTMYYKNNTKKTQYNSQHATTEIYSLL